MKYFLAILLAAILVLGAAILTLIFGWQEGDGAVSPEASQSTRQMALTPTLRLEGRRVKAGVVVRGQDAAPAELTKIGGSATVREEGSLPELRFSQQPDQTTVTLTRGDAGEETPLLLGTLEQLADYSPPEDGTYLLDLWASWDGTAGGFAGLAGYRIALIYERSPEPSSQPAPAVQTPQPPQSSSQPEGIQLSIDRQEVPQGYCLLLRASGLPEGAGEVSAVTDMGFTPTFYPYRGEMVALMPAKYGGDTGEYHITLTAGAESRDFTIRVVDGGFNVTVQQFTVDQSVADSTVNNQEADITYEQVTRPLKNLGDPEKYWDGPFQLPIDPRYKVSTSTFGRIRIINGSKSQHAGIDYPAPTGTQVYAPNNGRVLFAGYLQLTGNMICIEHGFGLKSWYYHLSAVEVEAGQMVKTGDPIGKVGATGFVTGPHLHFTMSVNNIYTNPEQYLAADPLG